MAYEREHEPASRSARTAWPSERRRPTLLALAAFALVLGSAVRAGATTYAVGPGQAFPTIASVPALGPGDVVEIQCGTYNEVRRWTDSATAESPITLRGVCATGRPVIDANRRRVSGNHGLPRAAWQIEGSHYRIENLEFRNARNRDNGAGIRVLGSDVTITDCKVSSCDMGIMSSGSDDLVITGSEIAFNGTGKNDGLSHNLYVAGGSVTIMYSRIHDAISGENVKSRAHYTALLYNHIADAAESEVEGVDGADTIAPNSNMVMIGNILVSRPDRSINTTKFINFGQDMGGSHDGTLYLINNTLIAGSPSIGFLRSSAPTSAIVVTNNVFFGSDTIVQPGFAAQIGGTHNWAQNTATLPPGFASTTTASSPAFVDPTLRNYRLTAGSSCRDTGIASPTYVDGSGTVRQGMPALEYVRHLRTAVRASDAALDLGAHEFGTPIPDEPPFVDAGLPQTIALLVPTTVQGQVLPGSVSVEWGIVSGPGKTFAKRVAFETPHALQTIVTFARRGVYVLSLTASDGVRSDFQEVAVTVSRN